MVQEDISQEDSQDSSRNSKDAFFDPKPKPKMIRILTVLAYILSVSMAAILLSIYYIFMWHGEPHLGAHRSIIVNHRDQERTKGLTKPELPQLNVVFPQRLMSNDDETAKSYKEDNETSYEYLNTTESIFSYYDNKTAEDMQRQLVALELEVKLDAPTTISSEDNTTTWQEEYLDNPEELAKSSVFIKRLFYKDDENY